jgi:hypothetical protein
MHADRIDLAGNGLARGRVDRLLIDHAADMRHGGGGVLDHRVGLLARRQHAGIGVSAVGEDFLGGAQAIFARGLALLGVGLAEEDQIAVDHLGGARARPTRCMERK